MKKLLHSRYGASKGAALIIVLAFVVLVTALALAHFSRTTTNRQLAQSSYTDTSADLLARSGLDIIVGSLKQEIVSAGAVTPSNIQPQRSAADASIPNLIRRSVRNDAISPPGVPSLASAVSSGPVNPADVKRGEITPARWNSHYLIPPGANFTAPDWVLVTGQGPNTAPAPSAVIGRYAFAVYDEGGLIDLNLGGFPTYASVTQPTRLARSPRRLRPSYPSEESEIIRAAFTPNLPCHDPKFTPNNTNASGGTGAPFVQTFNTNGTAPQTFTANFLPHGLSIDPSTGTISGVPTSPGGFTITLTVTNACGSDTGTLNLTINGRVGPETTPWPVNLARKGTVAFADLTALPSTPTLTPAQINKLMGWRNYATTQQPPSASFDNPQFLLATADNFAQYFLGSFPPPNYVFTTPFTIVSAVPDPANPSRTDQAVMTRQELIKLQRTIGFSQSLLQYLGTFSRDENQPAPDWSQTLTARWDMNNLQGVYPDSWDWPGHHGVGHAFGKQRHSFIGQLFGLTWVFGKFTPGTRLTDPDYYGHWKYTIHNLNQWSDTADFFQVINNAMKLGNGGVSPNPKTVFTVGAAIIDQYDPDDLYDPDPNPPNNGNFGNTITIIDTVGSGNPADYVYGIEGMSFDDPDSIPPPPVRPGAYCPYPPPVPANYALLNRRFENVGEFGYAYSPASTTASKTLDFASSTSKDKPLLDFFTYNTALKRAGIVNLNTRNGPVLGSIISGALLHDPGDVNTPTSLVSAADALAAGQAIVQETTNNGPALTRADVSRLVAAAAPRLPVVPGVPVDEVKQTIARALAEAGQTRAWNLMIDVIAQTGNYAPGTLPSGLTDPTKFIVQGEKRYWLHIALGRDLNSDGTVDVLGSQLEEVVE
jgi:hypothetical protein